MEKLFKSKKLNYKKVGYTHTFVLKEILVKIIRNFVFKRVLLIIDYLI